ncbi:MAG: hypothetical protein HFE97_11585 [Oscillospiraceae bacterium]|nr:hypothetical protein [Oscillospiraceae bacterium]
MKEIKIERLPAMLAHPPSDRPEMSQDNAYSTHELEGLAGQLYLWLQDEDADLPKLPLLRTERFQARYGRAFDPWGYLDRLIVLLDGLYPVHEFLFRADPDRFYEACCTKVKIHPKPLAERVYWKRELSRVEEGDWLTGYCGILDQEQWEEDFMRPAYEKELSVQTAYLFAKAASQVHYPALLFYTVSGWPLAIRIR